MVCKHYVNTTSVTSILRHVIARKSYTGFAWLLSRLRGCKNLRSSARVKVRSPRPPRSRGGVPISAIMIICSSPLGLGEAGGVLFPPPPLFRGWGVYEASEAQPLRATQVNIMDTYRTRNGVGGAGAMLTKIKRFK